MDRDTFIKSLKKNFNWIFDLGYDLKQVERVLGLVPHQLLPKFLGKSDV
ncbi:MAG: hypothetical protein R6U66_04020 [Bacteroidales bacterium]